MVITESVLDHVASADGTPIGFERLGAGPPLVLVHGGVADRTRWASIAPRLAERFTVHLIDRRGRGASGDAGEPGQPYRLGREVEDIRAVISACGAPVRLLGHSYGALCSLEVALLTDRVERVLLYEPPFATPGLPAVPEQLVGLLEGFLAKGDREAVLVTMLSGGAGIDEPTLAVMRKAASWQARIDAVPTIVREVQEVNRYVLGARRFALLDTPVRLLVGTESPAAVKAASAAVHAALPDSDVVELPGQGHAAMDTAPDLFLDEVFRFFG